jgi:hypothetical protein
MKKEGMQEYRRGIQKTEVRIQKRGSFAGNWHRH